MLASCWTQRASVVICCHLLVGPHRSSSVCLSSSVSDRHPLLCVYPLLIVCRHLSIIVRPSSVHHHVIVCHRSVDHHCPSVIVCPLTVQPSTIQLSTIDRPTVDHPTIICRPSLCVHSSLTVNRRPTVICHCHPSSFILFVIVRHCCRWSSDGAHIISYLQWQGMVRKCKRRKK